MNFLSFEFTLQFLLFLITYWLFSKHPKIQNLLLIVMGYVFLLESSVFFAVTLFSYAVLIFILGKIVLWTRGQGKKGKYTFTLIITFIVALSPLLYFKYTEFFLSQLQQVLVFIGIPTFGSVNEILAPLGISYYTFNSISYLVSLKRKEIGKPNFINTLQFVSFFPTLTAGPIFRAKDLLKQINSVKVIGNISVISMLIILAIIKKWWISGWLANAWVDPIFASPSDYNSIEILTGVYAYAIQIYFDFSGYTDLVTALMLLLGYKAPVNFNMPYYAVSLKDFWARWHISLSTWIRDYIYIPLGGNRHGFILTQVFLAIGMMASGLWHGATFNFIIWAALHTVGVIFLNFWAKSNVTLSVHFPWFSRIITFHYICLTWVFFRATDFTSAKDLLYTFCVAWTQPLTTNVIIVLAVLIFAFFFLRRISLIPAWFAKMLASYNIFSQALISILILAIVVVSAPAGIPQFIYANF